MPDEPEPPSIDEIRRLMREWDRQLDELPSDPRQALYLRHIEHRERPQERDPPPGLIRCVAWSSDRA